MGQNWSLTIAAVGGWSRSWDLVPFLSYGRGEWPLWRWGRGGCCQRSLLGCGKQERALWHTGVSWGSKGEVCPKTPNDGELMLHQHQWKKLKVIFKGCMCAQGLIKQNLRSLVCPRTGVWSSSPKDLGGGGVKDLAHSRGHCLHPEIQGSVVSQARTAGWAGASKQLQQ